MKLTDIKRVLIIGAGTMGQQIGLQCAIHGYDVVYYDLSREILDQSLKNVTRLANWYASTRRITEEQLKQTMNRITATPNPELAAQDVDLISESVLEDPVVKGETFARFHQLCPERTIFTTNTSLLLPSMFAQASGRPEKLCALHFHDLRSNNVVDVMPHPGTAPEVTQLVCDFAESIGQVVILLQKEKSGYVFNTMLSSLFRSALTLATRGVTSIEDIDRAWMGVTGMTMGPFGLMDQVGLATVWDITSYWADKQGDDQAKINANFLKQYVDKGLLGYKTRQGFYSYPNPAYKDFFKAKKS